MAKNAETDMDVKVVRVSFREFFLGDTIAPHLARIARRAGQICRWKVDRGRGTGHVLGFVRLAEVTDPGLGSRAVGDLQRTGGCTFSAKRDWVFGIERQGA